MGERRNQLAADPLEHRETGALRDPACRGRLFLIHRCAPGPPARSDNRFLSTVFFGSGFSFRPRRSTRRPCWGASDQHRSIAARHRATGFLSLRQVGNPRGFPAPCGPHDRGLPALPGDAPVPHPGDDPLPGNRDSRALGAAARRHRISPLVSPDLPGMGPGRHSVCRPVQNLRAEGWEGPWDGAVNPGGGRMPPDSPALWQISPADCLVIGSVTVLRVFGDGCVSLNPLMSP